MGIQNKKDADADAAGGGKGSASVEAHTLPLDLYAVRGEVGVLAGVGEFVEGVAEDGGLAGSTAKGELGRVHAVAGLQPDAVLADEGDSCDGSVAYLGGETCDVVEDGIRRGVEHLVLAEGFDPESFVFDEECIHRSLKLREARSGLHCHFRVSSWNFKV